MTIFVSLSKKNPRGVQASGPLRLVYCVSDHVKVTLRLRNDTVSDEVECIMRGVSRTSLSNTSNGTFPRLHYKSSSL
jgi:hypothetical protein